MRKWDRTTAKEENFWGKICILANGTRRASKWVRNIPKRILETPQRVRTQCRWVRPSLKCAGSVPKRVEIVSKHKSPVLCREVRWRTSVAHFHSNLRNRVINCDSAKRSVADRGTSWETGLRRHRQGSGMFPYIKSQEVARVKRRTALRGGR